MIWIWVKSQYWPAATNASHVHKIRICRHYSLCSTGGKNMIHIKLQPWANPAAPWHKNRVKPFTLEDFSCDYMTLQRRNLCTSRCGIAEEIRLIYWKPKAKMTGMIGDSASAFQRYNHRSSEHALSTMRRWSSFIMREKADRCWLSGILSWLDRLFPQERSLLQKEKVSDAAVVINRPHSGSFRTGTIWVCFYSILLWFSWLLRLSVQEPCAWMLPAFHQMKKCLIPFCHPAPVLLFWWPAENSHCCLAVSWNSLFRSDSFPSAETVCSVLRLPPPAGLSLFSDSFPPKQSVLFWHIFSSAWQFPPLCPKPSESILN